MIVQAPEVPGGRAFVILQNDHTAFGGDVARHFGNERFAAPEPYDLVVDLVRWHDQGWTELDERFLQDVETGLPCSLAGTPFDELIETSKLSPSLGEARHPFIGLISSMHSCGLYNGRYGLSDFVFLNLLEGEQLKVATEMLAEEERRQERLRRELAADPSTVALASEGAVHRAYHVLQFIDTLALYMQCEHPSRHSVGTIPSVPTDDDPDHDVTITVTPMGAGTYQIDPYPFDRVPFVTATPGRYLDPAPLGSDLRAAWAAAPPTQQTVTFVPVDVDASSA